MKVLISGFEPFEGMSHNSSEQLVNSLSPGDFDFPIETVILPVSFQKAFAILRAKIDAVHPDVVVATGLAWKRKEITPERIAINCMDARTKDNDGNRPQHQKVRESGPDGIFSTLPLDLMVEASKKAGVPASISNTAGTYVCNLLMFELLEFSKQKNIRAGFIHVPPTPQISYEGFGMDLLEMKTGFSAMLKVLELTR